MSGLKFTKRIGFRIAATVAVLVTLGVSLAAALFIVHDFNQTMEAERKRMTATASAFAAASAAPLAAGDRNAIYGAIRGITDVEGSTLVSVETRDGEMVAEIGASVSLQRRSGDAEERTNLSLFQADSIHVVAPVRFGGNQIGSLKLHKDMRPLRQQYLDTLLLLIAGAASAALLISMAAFVAINRALSPLHTMSQTLSDMGREPALSARFDIARNDEVGVLAGAFNNAFSTIKERDDALREHRDQLEETVEKRTEELKVAAQEARQANAAKSDFLATMSHEIRTPMNGMLVMAELLAASGLPNRQQRFAEVITRSGNALLSIINDILDMSKIEAGKLELEAVPFSLETLVHDTVSLYSARAMEKGLSLSAIIAPQVADAFIGDPTRLGQVLSNLANNAIKFTQTGGVTIEVTNTNGENPQALQISVRDTGIGIPADKLATIFDAFSQADQSTTRMYGGTGLGLSITRRLITAMNGDISVESEPGCGTAFTVAIELPVHADAKPLAKLPRDYRIAVLEDNGVAKENIEKMLTLWGFSIAALNTVPDLILCGSISDPGRIDIALAASKTPVITLSNARETRAIAARANVVGSFSGTLDRARISTLITCLNEGTWDTLLREETRELTAPSYDDFSVLRVLAVDDNPVNREVLRETLTAFHVDAVFAESGEQAIEIVSRQTFDIIFMDCSMPGMDGYEATAKIRKTGQSRDAKIVALTAHVTGPEAERWQAAGMDHYIAKPFRVAQIAEVFAKFAHAQPAPQNTHPESVDNDDVLLSTDTLAMFEALAATNGSGIKEKIFSMFLSEVDGGFNAVRQAFERHTDTNALKTVVHALKSMCSSAGAAKAQNLCETVEQMAESGEWPSHDVMDALEAALAETRTAMRDHIASDDAFGSKDLIRTAS